MTRCEQQIFEVDELLRRVCDLLGERAAWARVVLAVTSSGGVICGSASRLRDALSNLLASALGACSPGQAIYLDAEWTAEGDHLWTIEHAGVGMPHELAIAMSIVAEHRGSLHFESAVGTGTTVTIRLPGCERVAHRPLEHVVFADLVSDDCECFLDCASSIV